MSRKTAALFALIILLALAGCRDQEPVALEGEETAVAAPTLTAEPEPEAEVALVEADLSTGSGGVVVISEVLVGVPGDNNREFIELYNASETGINLDGYSLWYQVDAGQEQQQVYTWEGRAELPPLGHLLLVQEGQDLGLTPDAFYSTPLSQRKGGLALRDAHGQAVAMFGWGDAPEGFVAGAAAAVPGDGASMERLPGGDAGHGVDSGDNTADFAANSTPNPQNSGSPATPLAEDHLLVSLAAPQTVEPGVEFDLLVTVENQGIHAANDVEVALPMVAGFPLLNGPEGAVEADGLLSWKIPSLEAGESVETTVTL